MNNIISSKNTEVDFSKEEICKVWLIKLKPVKFFIALSKQMLFL